MGYKASLGVRLTAPARHVFVRAMITFHFPHVAPLAPHFLYRTMYFTHLLAHPAPHAVQAAVDQLTRCAAVDLAKDGIRVNAINPGVIVTPLQRRGGLSDEQYAAFLQRSTEVSERGMSPPYPLPIVPSPSHPSFSYQSYARISSIAFISILPTSFADSRLHPLGTLSLSSLSPFPCR